MAHRTSPPDGPPDGPVQMGPKRSIDRFKNRQSVGLGNAKHPPPRMLILLETFDPPYFPSQRPLSYVSFSPCRFEPSRPSSFVAESTRSHPSPGSGVRRTFIAPIARYRSRPCCLLFASDRVDRVRFPIVMGGGAVHPEEADKTARPAADPAAGARKDGRPCRVSRRACRFRTGDHEPCRDGL